MTATIPMGVVLVADALHSRWPFGFGTMDGVLSITLDAACADCAMLIANPMVAHTTLIFHEMLRIALPSTGWRRGLPSTQLLLLEGAYLAGAGTREIQIVTHVPVRT